jgi:signal-transduction protein with cAMP-binding, CBS, and nucleotidyltransferase domain
MSRRITMQIKKCTLLKQVTCLPSDSITTAAKKMKKNKLRHLYVVDRKMKLLGVFAAIDIVYDCVAAGKQCGKAKVEAMMKTDIVSFTDNDPVLNAVGFMSNTSIFTVPVTHDDKIVGVLSYREAMQRLAKK